MTLRLGIDTGGAVTDLIGVNEEGGAPPMAPAATAHGRVQERRPRRSGRHRRLRPAGAQRAPADRTDDLPWRRGGGGGVNASTGDDDVHDEGSGRCRRPEQNPQHDR